MATISQINAKSFLTSSKLDGVTYSTISQVDGTNTRGVIFSSAYSLSGTSAGTTTASGSVTVYGTTATFNAFATVSTGGPCNSSINVGGNARTAAQSTIGTNTSTTFTLGTGTYSYTSSLTITAGICQGGIQFTQP